METNTYNILLLDNEITPALEAFDSSMVGGLGFIKTKLEPRKFRYRSEQITIILSIEGGVDAKYSDGKTRTLDFNDGGCKIVLDYLTGQRSNLGFDLILLDKNWGTGEGGDHAYDMLEEAGDRLDGYGNLPPTVIYTRDTENQVTEILLAVRLGARGVINKGDAAQLLNLLWPAIMRRNTVELRKGLVRELLKTHRHRYWITSREGLEFLHRCVLTNLQNSKHVLIYGQAGLNIDDVTEGITEFFYSPSDPDAKLSLRTRIDEFDKERYAGITFSTVILELSAVDEVASKAFFDCLSYLTPKTERLVMSLKMGNHAEFTKDELERNFTEALREGAIQHDQDLEALKLPPIFLEYPPIRRRTEDLKAYGEWYFRNRVRKLKLERTDTISPEELEALASYPAPIADQWPKNLEEVECVIDLALARVACNPGTGLVFFDENYPKTPEDVQSAIDEHRGRKLLSHEEKILARIIVRDSRQKDLLELIVDSFPNPVSKGDIDKTLPHETDNGLSTLLSRLRERLNKCGFDLPDRRKTNGEIIMERMQEQ